MRILLYYHSGSKNHGCEAIVRGICKLFPDAQILLYTFDAQADREYGLDKLVTIKACNPKKAKYTLIEKVLIKLRILRVTEKCYRDMLKEDVDWAFAIGGDSYCYVGQPRELAYINRIFKKRNIRTALLGCSIDSQILNNKKVVKDLQNYDYVIPRESLTYAELRKCGLKNLSLFADPAFLLNKRTDIVELCREKKWIGINISPLIMRNETSPGIIYKNYKCLIEYILDRTEYNVALIPHVTVNWDNDISVLKHLYDEISREDRIQLIEENSCEVLKGVVFQCDFVICSRTHVSIAAYSEKIPALVVGYSIKSKGIATDLFGTHENYVIPAETLYHEEDLKKAFCWLQEREQQVSSQLEQVVPQLQNKLMNLNSMF